VTPPSAQGRLHDLATGNQLARLEAPNLAAARELHDDAAAHAKAVEVLLTVPDYSATVLLAYETARKSALGLLLAAGWRPTGGEGEHRITFEAAGHLLTARAARALDDAAFLRRRRNDNMYRQERADEAAAREAAEITRRVSADVLPALRALLS
jgi:hypothetical protein